MWNLPPPPGFQGLHPDKPVTVYHRHLPHWRQDGATYFVTFRLNDSLPEAKLHELRTLREEWERREPLPRTKEWWEGFSRANAERAEAWLDEGHGECLLKDSKFAQFLVNSFHYFDLPRKGSCTDANTPRYELGAYVVMPNHAHVIVRPIDAEQYPLENIIGGWKQNCSQNIHRVRGTRGTLWQDEAFDRIIRDAEHLWRAIQYIGSNPERARLSATMYAMWLRPEWEQLGWTLEVRRQ